MVSASMLDSLGQLDALTVVFAVLSRTRPGVTRALRGPLPFEVAVGPRHHVSEPARHVNNARPARTQRRNRHHDPSAQRIQR